jgi:hypothetical protein
MLMKTGPNLGKQATVFAVIVLISIGLCGYTSYQGENALGVGMLGLLGLFVGGLGLLVTGIRAVFRRKP